MDLLMHKKLHLLLTFLLLATAAYSSLYSETGTELVAKFDFINESEFNKASLSGQHISLVVLDLEAQQILPCSDTWGFISTLGNSYTNLRWTENPKFQEQHFNYVNLGIGAYALFIPEWVWKTQVTVSFDPEKFDSSYALLYGVLWGKYSYCQTRYGDLNLHFGFWGRIGLENSLVLPVIGLDYMPFCNLKANIIFPIDISLSYTVAENTSLELKSSTFRRRHRVDNNEAEPYGVFEYRNGGAEFGATYDNSSWILANVHLGYTFGQDLKVQDSKGLSSTFYEFGGSGYIGGKLSLKF
jgi:hypothetical protein